MSSMDLHDAHVQLEQLDFSGLSHLVHALKDTPNLSSSSRARVTKKLKKSLHLLLNEEPSLRAVLLAQQAAVESLEMADYSAVQDATTTVPGVGTGLAVPAAAPARAEDGQAPEGEGDHLAEQEAPAEVSVLETFDLWEPILNFALDWPTGWGRLSCVCRAWRRLCSSPVAWEGHHVQLSRRDIVGIWPPICHLGAVWASCESLRLPDRLPSETEEMLLAGFERRQEAWAVDNCYRRATEAAKAKRRRKSLQIRPVVQDDIMPLLLIIASRIPPRRRRRSRRRPCTRSAIGLRRKGCQKIVLLRVAFGAGRRIRICQKSLAPAASLTAGHAKLFDSLLLAYLHVDADLEGLPELDTPLVSLKSVPSRPGPDVGDGPLGGMSMSLKPAVTATTLTKIACAEAETLDVKLPTSDNAVPTFSSLLLRRAMPQLFGRGANGGLAATSEQKLLLPVQLRNSLPLLTSTWYDFENSEQSVDLPSPRRVTARRTAESSKGFGVLVGAQYLRKRTLGVLQRAVLGAREQGGDGHRSHSPAPAPHGSGLSGLAIPPLAVEFAEFRRFRLYLQQWTAGCRLDIGVTQVPPPDQKSIRFAEDLLGCWIVEASGLLVGSHPGVRLRCETWNAATGLQQGDVLECRIYGKSGDLELLVNGQRRGCWGAKIRKSPKLYPVVDLFEHRGRQLTVVLLQE
eukprot:g17132.t1